MVRNLSIKFATDREPTEKLPLLNDKQPVQSHVKLQHRVGKLHHHATTHYPVSTKIDSSQKLACRTLPWSSLTIRCPKVTDPWRLSLLLTKIDAHCLPFQLSIHSLASFARSLASAAASSASFTTVTVYYPLLTHTCISRALHVLFSGA